MLSFYWPRGVDQKNLNSPRSPGFPPRLPRIQLSFGSNIGFPGRDLLHLFMLFADLFKMFLWLVWHQIEVL